MKKCDLKYLGIIDHTRKYSLRHPVMPNDRRAAQFAPFAALIGYEESICEEARETERKKILSEDELQELNRKCEILKAHISEKPIVHIEYFKPDLYKAGGQYVSAVGKLENIDMQEKTITLLGGEAINAKSIKKITSQLF